MWWQGHEVTLVCTSSLFFFPFCLSLVCQTPSELHAQTHSVKLTHMLKDVFICFPVALERVCMYVCARVHVWTEGCYCCWVSRFLSCHPACLQGPLQPEEFVFIWFQGPSSHSDMHLVRKNNNTKKTNVRYNGAGWGRRRGGVPAVFWLLPSSEYLVISN